MLTISWRLEFFWHGVHLWGRKYLRALKFVLLNKLHTFLSIGKIFCVELHNTPLKFLTEYLTHTLKDSFFIHYWKFQSSQIYELVCVFEIIPGWYTKQWRQSNPNRKVHGANMGPHVGPMNLAIREHAQLQMYVPLGIWLQRMFKIYKQVLKRWYLTFGLNNEQRIIRVNPRLISMKLTEMFPVFVLV